MPVTSTRDEERVSVKNCPDYDESTVVESNEQMYMVGRYDGPVDICPLVTCSEDDEYDYDAGGEKLPLSESAVTELVEFLA